MSKEKEWTEAFGKKFAVFSRMYAFLVSTLNRMGIGPEIVDWVTTHEGVKAFGEAIEFFGERFLIATTPVVELKPVTFVDFSVWKTIKRNPERRTCHDYGLVLQSDGGCLVTHNTTRILLRVGTIEGDDDYDLYRISPRTLCLSDSITRREFYDAVLSAGFEVCPLWIGFELVANSIEQRSIFEKDILIGIDPVEAGGIPRVLKIECRSTSRSITAVNENPGDRHNMSLEWVFVKRRPKQPE